MKVPIVCAVMQHDDPYAGDTCMLACKEAPNVPAIKYNIIPPFLMREARLIAGDLPSTKHHHSTHFQDEDMRMSLRFHGVFYAFYLRIR